MIDPAAPVRNTVRLCLAGDVMLGRGVDQILGQPGDPAIHEPWARSAETYVELAERESGPIPRRVDPTYVWGDALTKMQSDDVDAVIVNLETAITDRGRPWPGKSIQYRMHPANVDCLTTAGVDVVTLANNHVLDWSEPGLVQTLETLRSVDVKAVGAGIDIDEAWTPAVVETAGGNRVVVVGVGCRSSGIPPEWAASESRPGVAWLGRLDTRAVRRVAAAADGCRREGDVVVVTIHWGDNWVDSEPATHGRFARRLIDEAGVHVVHGHSSHHALGVEIHNRCLILHGSGDLMTDYEGIGGHERFRGELGGLYLPQVDARTGRLAALEIVPTRMRRFRLTDPDRGDKRWFADALTRRGAAMGTTVQLTDDGRLRVEW